ncbi:MAG: LPS export ABC transporter permease LptF [Desulfovibrio sp.]|jgi:lipopolysaccharide export system permease protein|nr:LPS export ABC transporter permease LptF [Desulfovibrio sp.]
MRLRLPGFTLLHLSILRELTLTFLVCAASLVSLILLSRGVHMRNLFLGLDLTASDIALIFLFLMPPFLVLVLPISCMVSVFLTFLRMSTDRELTAVKAGGIGIYQMARSPAFFSFVCMCLASFISVYGIAWGMGNFRSIVLNIANSRIKVVVQPGVFNKDVLGLTLFARQVDPASGRLKQVIFEDKTGEDKTSLTILAPEGEITTEPEHGDIVLNLRDGRIYRAGEDNNISVMTFGEYKVRLSLSKLFSGIDLGDVTPNEMSWKTLLEMQANSSAPDARFQRRVEVELHKRATLPVACMVLGVFAMPLACAFQGVHRQMGAALALLLFLIYYSVYSFGLTLGESGRLPPALGLWLPNILFALAGGFGLHLTNSEGFPSVARFAGNLRQNLRACFNKDKKA